MRQDTTAALRLALQGHLSLRKSRLESFCVLVVGVLQVGLGGADHADADDRGGLGDGAGDSGAAASGEAPRARTTGSSSKRCMTSAFTTLRGAPCRPSAGTGIPCGS